MRRRDLGKFALVGLGAAAVTTSTAGVALAAGTKTKGTGYKIVSKKGKKEGKFYLLPSATVAVAPGSQVQFQYKGVLKDKHTFELIDAGTVGTGETFPLVINGSPSTELSASPTHAVLIDSVGEQPITVEQPGG